MIDYDSANLSLSVYNDENGLYHVDLFWSFAASLHASPRWKGDIVLLRICSRGKNWRRLWKWGKPDSTCDGAAGSFFLAGTSSLHSVSVGTQFSLRNRISMLMKLMHTNNPYPWTILGLVG